MPFYSLLFILFIHFYSHIYHLAQDEYVVFIRFFRLKLCFSLFITSTPVLSFCIGIALMLYICFVKVI